MAEPVRRKVAVLISGRGSNMEALLKATQEPGYPGEIVLVASDHTDAGGLETARAAGIETVAHERKTFPDRAAHEAAVIAAIEASGAEFVCLAGYMRILSSAFVAQFEGRMLNIHPSLLPLFPGLDTHQRALDSGMRLHGCTVHFVTEIMDGGPIVAQAAIPIRPGDTAQNLATRLLSAEHRLYAYALRLVLDGRARMVGNRAVVDMEEADGAGILVSPLASCRQPKPLQGDAPSLMVSLSNHEGAPVGADTLVVRQAHHEGMGAPGALTTAGSTGSP